jgi:hypothetical protein
VAAEVAADNAIAPATANEPPLSAVIHSAVIHSAAIHSAVIHSAVERLAAVRLGLANLARKTHATRKKAEVDNAPNNASLAAKDGPKAEAVSAEVETEAVAIEAVIVVANEAVTEVVTEVDAVAVTIAGKFLYRQTANPLQTLPTNIARFDQQKIDRISRVSPELRANLNGNNWTNEPFPPVRKGRSQTCSLL